MKLFFIKKKIARKTLCSIVTLSAISIFKKSLVIFSDSIKTAGIPKIKKGTMQLVVINKKSTKLFSMYNFLIIYIVKLFSSCSKLPFTTIKEMNCTNNATTNTGKTLLIAVPIINPNVYPIEYPYLTAGSEIELKSG